MATATQKVRRARRVARPASAVSAPKATEVLVLEDPSVDLGAQRDAALGYDSDAERWMDEGGSFSSEAVTQWQVPR